MDVDYQITGTDKSRRRLNNPLNQIHDDEHRYEANIRRNGNNRGKMKNIIDHGRHNDKGQTDDYTDNGTIDQDGQRYTTTSVWRHPDEVLDPDAPFSYEYIDDTGLPQDDVADAATTGGGYDVEEQYVVENGHPTFQSAPRNPPGTGYDEETPVEDEYFVELTAPRNPTGTGYDEVVGYEEEETDEDGITDDFIVTTDYNDMMQETYVDTDDVDEEEEEDSQQQWIAQVDWMHQQRQQAKKQQGISFRAKQTSTTRSRTSVAASSANGSGLLAYGADGEDHGPADMSMLVCDQCFEPLNFGTFGDSLRCSNIQCGTFVRPLTDATVASLPFGAEVYINATFANMVAEKPNQPIRKQNAVFGRTRPVLIDEAVVAYIRAAIMNTTGARKASEISIDDVLGCVRTHGWKQYYDDKLVHVFCRVTHRPLPVMTPTCFTSAHNYFRRARAAYARIDHEYKRLIKGDFLDYHYAWSRIVQLIGAQHIVPYVLRLDGEKLRLHNALWRAICADCGWQYSPVSKWIRHAIAPLANMLSRQVENYLAKEAAASSEEEVQPDITATSTETIALNTSTASMNSAASSSSIGAKYVPFLTEEEARALIAASMSRDVAIERARRALFLEAQQQEYALIDDMRVFETSSNAATDVWQQRMNNAVKEEDAQAREWHNQMLGNSAHEARMDTEEEARYRAEIDEAELQVDAEEAKRVALAEEKAAKARAIRNFKARERRAAQRVAKRAAATRPMMMVIHER